ncbi:hypothetical protein Tco_1132427 [Tanacetum coccineum]|uniref:Uncharacterized protein n=1 Tax=Tanacetum coccineum TaxID=301880 RepID=A0ABQ5JBU5_9ASTR
MARNPDPWSFGSCSCIPPWFPPLLLLLLPSSILGQNSRLKVGLYLNSSRLESWSVSLMINILVQFFLASVLDDRYSVSNGSGYAVLICWDEYVVLDRELVRRIRWKLDTAVFHTVD